MFCFVASRPHIEWLTAYRKAKETQDNVEETDDNQNSKVPMFGYPPNSLPANHPGSAFSLRNLLDQKNNTGQQSASGFLRSIVQAVMQQGNAPGQGPSTTSIYDSLVNNQQAKTEEAQAAPPSTEQPQDGEVVEGGEIKRKGSKRKAAAPSTPAVMPKYPATTQRDRKYSVSNTGSPAADIAPRAVHTIPKSPSMTSLQSRSNTSSPISVGGDMHTLPRSHSASSLISEDGVRDCRFGPTELAKTQYNSPSDFQRSALSPALSWSDTESEQARALALQQNRLQRRRTSMDSDVSSVSSVSKEINSCKDQISNNLQVGSPVHNSPIYHFPLNQQPQNIQYSDQDSGERSRFDFTSMSKNYDSIPGEASRMSTTEVASVPGQELFISPSGATQCDGEERVEKTKGVIKCEHCGISFEDEVLHSIHMGCHSHTDPFKCNVCGRSCENRYGFYTHIMRGHHP